jgi:creatinine amidohydrolase
MELEMERLRSPEFAERVAKGWTTVVFACGAVEQHGPHLPLFVDAEHGTRLAVEVARRLDETFVAPTVRIGCSEHHMTFPGTISVQSETLEAVCHDYCVSLVRHGIRRICIIPSHGGNFAPLAIMLPRLRAAVAPDCEIVTFDDLMGLADLWRRVIEDQLGHGDRVGAHADIAETSIMKALHPDLVRDDLAEPGYTEPLSSEVVERLMSEGMAAVSRNGILGDARGATAGAGEACIAALADWIAEGFRPAR